MSAGRLDRVKVISPEDRLALIHRPFFIRTLPISYPFGGCVVADTFYGDDVWLSTGRYLGSGAAAWTTSTGGVLAAPELPDSFVHNCGGLATPLAPGPPYLVGRSAADARWRQTYACEKCNAVVTHYEDIRSVPRDSQALPLALAS
jgi:hypothetical protein